MQHEQEYRHRRYFQQYCRPMTARAPAVRPRLPRLEGIETILFDIYGTLVISASGDVGTILENRGISDFRRMVKDNLDLDLPAEPDIDDLVVREIRRDHEKKPSDECSYPEVEIRSIWYRVLTQLFPDAGSISNELTENVAVLYELSRNKVWPMPGSLELLRSINRHFRLGIVSNAQFYTPLMLYYFFDELFSRFEPQLCVWSYIEGCAKPEKRLFRKIIGSQDPSKFLYIGNDMLNDVAAASAVGMRTILFAGDRRSLRLRRGDERLGGAEPDGVITHLNQLSTILALGETH